jgi:CheY-like chemotaxis protein
MQRIIAKTINTNVLVVDDNDVNLMIAKSTLESYGINVSVAGSGAAAIDKLSSDDFFADLVILDCIMPEMDGHETARRIRAFKGTGLPIVAYTANDPESVLAEFKDVAVSDVLVKPLDNIELTRLLLKYLPDEKFVEKDRVIADLSQLDAVEIPAAPEKKTRLEEYLSRFPELDYATGLRYSAGSEESYLNVLRAALESMKSGAASVNDFCSRSNDAVVADADSAKDFRVTVHSMKGICASIGLDALSKSSAEYEQLVKDAEGSVTLSGLADYAEELYGAGELLSQIIRDYDASFDLADETAHIDMDPEMFRSLWERTLERVRLFDIDAVKEGLKTLQSAATDPDRKARLKTAIEAANCFDYNKVAEMLK